MFRMKSEFYQKLENVLDFFSNGKVYMFGDFEVNRHIMKFLSFNGIKIEGYIVSSVWDRIVLMSHYANKYDFTIYIVDEISTLEEIKIAVHAENYDLALLDAIKSKGAKDIILIEKEICDCCFRTFHPRNRDTFILEIDVCEHCNLKCNNCYHFSQVAEPTFLEPDEFRRDMERMSELSGGLIRKIYLMGGEPLLHPKLNEIIKIARDCFPYTFIQIITNGTLLLTAESAVYGNLYEICVQYNIAISVTEYPVKLDIGRIEELTKSYNVLFWNKLETESIITVETLSNRKEKLMQKATFDLAKQQNPSVSALMCYFAGNCFTLKHGKLATCPVILNIHHFNKAFGENVRVSKDDYIDIHKANTFFELAEFMAKPVPFCGYCDFRNRPHEKWKTSSKTIDEYIES